MAEAVFSAAFLLLGCGGLLWMLSAVVLPEWRVNHEFVQTPCRVLEKRINEKQSSESGQLYQPEFKIEYKVAGVLHSDWHYGIEPTYAGGQEEAQTILDRFELYSKHHKTYPCWYDPTDPDVAVLVRGYGWVIWLVLTVPLSFIIIGAGGLLHLLFTWGKSAERRAVQTQRVGERGRDFFDGGGNGDACYPTVPKGADITISPGTKLKFRLPMATSPGWAMFGTLAFCVFWNGIVAVAVTIAVSGFIAGTPNWLLTLLTVPFVAIGIGAIVYLVRQLLVTTGIGPTLIEISDHPLHPGERYRAFLSQSGWLTVKTLRVLLVCEEVATYRQGTDTRSETRETHREELFRCENFEIRGGQPLECDIDLNLPEEAMHSFAAAHNEIAWTLVVEGESTGWPDYRRAFTVIVHPATREPTR